MKTFKDLQFEDHPIGMGHKWASLTFENGYGVSVIFGDLFYSDGFETYELAVLYNDEITYNTDITDDVIGYLNESQVTDIMIKVQQL